MMIASWALAKYAQHPGLPTGGPATRPRAQYTPLRREV